MHFNACGGNGRRLRDRPSTVGILYVWTIAVRLGRAPPGHRSKKNGRRNLWFVLILTGELIEAARGLPRRGNTPRLCLMKVTSPATNSNKQQQTAHFCSVCVYTMRLCGSSLGYARRLVVGPIIAAFAKRFEFAPALPNMQYTSVCICILYKLSCIFRSIFGSSGNRKTTGFRRWQR